MGVVRVVVVEKFEGKYWVFKKGKRKWVIRQTRKEGREWQK